MGCHFFGPLGISKYSSIASLIPSICDCCTKL